MVSSANHAWVPRHVYYWLFFKRNFLVYWFNLMKSRIRICKYVFFVTIVLQPEVILVTPVVVVLVAVVLSSGVVLVVVG